MRLHIPDEALDLIQHEDVLVGTLAHGVLLPDVVVVLHRHLKKLGWNLGPHGLHTRVRTRLSIINRLRTVVRMIFIRNLFELGATEYRETLN